MWEKKLVETLINKKRVIMALVAVISLGALACLPNLRFDASISSWFLEDDPDLVTYRQFLSRFEADEITVMAVFSEELFSPENLESLAELTKHASEAPYAQGVRSLANMNVLDTRKGLIEVGPLMDDPPISPAEAKGLESFVKDSPLLSKLVSKDGNATAIIIGLSPEGNSFDGKIEQVGALQRISAEHAGKLQVKLAGSPPVNDAFMRYSIRDSMILLPLITLLVIIITLLMYRRISATLITLGVVGLSTLWVVGLMACVGLTLNVVSSALMALILAVGVANTVHIISAYYTRLCSGEQPHEACVNSTAHLLIPCFFTSATTIVGFMSLLVSNLAPIREFGYLAAIGVAFTLLLSFTLVPALLPHTKAPDGDFIKRQQGGLLIRGLRRVSHMSRTTAWGLVIASVPVILGAVWLVANLEVGANVLSYFRVGDPVRVVHEEVEAALGGASTLEFLVEAPDEGLKDPEILGRLQSLQAWTEGLPGVTGSISVVDLVKEMNRGLVGNYEIPDSSDMVAQLYFLMEGDESFQTLVQDDFSVTRLTSQAALTHAKDLVQQLERIDTMLESQYNTPELKVQLTGYFRLMSEMETYLIRSQIESFTVAFLAITAMMFLLLRSIPLGLFSMIPNLLPILVGLGFMSLIGIRLDPGTVMIGCIALGLVVDDTVHALVNLRRNVKAGLDLDAAITRTLEETGRPIVITSLILACGFSVMSAGSFTPNIHFGQVASVVIILALGADLVLLPAALKAFRPKL